ncbi:MAG TPA: hypothetical protein VFT58_05550 [Nitrososphaera sp.]|nr:hypothetical protein [Nitrososphaera sp.]
MANNDGANETHLGVTWGLALEDWAFMMTDQDSAIGDAVARVRDLGGRLLQSELAQPYRENIGAIVLAARGVANMPGRAVAMFTGE